MRLLKKQESLVQNMAYMGMMASVNITFILLTHFVPFLLFVLVFTLPLCSAIISYYCKKVYFPIYLIVVSAICLVIDFSDALFYVIPSIITGFFFGLFIEKKVPSIYIIMIITTLQFGLSLLGIPLIKVITNRDIVMDFATIFKVNEYEYLNYVKYTFIYFISFVQIFITYIVMDNELHKFKMAFQEIGQSVYILDILSIVSVATSILFGFLVPEISFIFLFVSFVFMIYRLRLLDYRHYKVYLIELISIILISIFFVALLYNNIVKPLGLLLVGIFPLLISFACIINFCLLSKYNKDTINN